MKSSDQKSLCHSSDNEDLEDMSEVLEKEKHSFDYTSQSYTENRKELPPVVEKGKKISFSLAAHPDIIEYHDDNDDDDSEATNLKILQCDLSEDTKMIEDAIADLDGKTTNESKAASRVTHENLTEVKASKRFVAVDGPELGDRVDHCLLTMSSNNVNVNIYTPDDFKTEQSNESIKSVTMIDEVID